MAALLDYVDPVIYGYPFIGAMALLSLSMAAWHTQLINDNHVDGYTSTSLAYKDGISDDYRMSEVLMFLFAQFTSLGAGLMITKLSGDSTNRMNLANIFKGIFFLAWVVQIITWIVYHLDGFKSDTRMASSIAIAIFSGAVLVMAIIQYASTRTLSPLNVKTNDDFPKVELAQRLFGLFYLVAAVVYINNGYILNKFGELAKSQEVPLAELEPANDDERGITLYTLGIALTVTDRKNAFARQVSLAAIAVIWIVTLGLDAGTASIKPTKSRFYDVHMASAAFHMVFAFAVTLLVQVYAYGNDKFASFGNYAKVPNRSKGYY